MKLHTLQTLAIFFVAVFVLTKGEENKEGVAENMGRRRLGDVTNFKAFSNNMILSSEAVAQTATEIKFEFTLATDMVSGNNIVFTTDPTNVHSLWATAATVPCTLTHSNGVKYTNPPTCTASATTTKIDILTCVAGSTTVAKNNGLHTLTCTDNIAPNPSSYYDWVFDISGTHDSKTDQPGWKVGLPRIYFRRSECRAGGLPAGAHTAGTLVSGYVKECKVASGINFFVKTGIQLVGGDAGTCFDNKKTKNRCDAMYFTDTSMDVAVSTYGNFGTLTCGAYTKGSSAPSYSIMSDTSTTLKSKNSIEVDEVDRYADQVVSLTGLPSDSQYAVYCHMSERVLSPMLLAWTDENDRIWGDTLIPAVTTASTSPVTLTLTFYHGLEMTNGAKDVISLTAIKGGDQTAIITSNVPACTATTTSPGSSTASDISITVARSAGASATGDIASTTSNAKITFTLSNAAQTSTAGSKIVIVCNSNLANNPASGTIVYDLHVEDHPTIRSDRFGYTIA